MAGNGSRRGWLSALLVLVLIAGLGGYAVADLRGIVPGILTTEPRPVPYPTIPAAPGLAAAVQVPPVVSALDANAPTPAPAGFAAQVSPLLADPALGPSVSATFVDTTTGRVLLDSAGSTPREPASVTKVLTSAAALSTLGPDTTLATTVVAQPGSTALSVVAGGDILMGSGPGDPDAVVGRAGLADLAEATAAALLDSGRSTVTVSLDDSVLGGIGWGESMGPGWTGTDLTSGFVAPVTGIAVNAGRIRDENYAPRVADPGLDATQQFAAALEKAGVQVDGPIRRQKAPAGAPELASVHSAPVAEIVAYLLDHSDNNSAEALSRLVAVHDQGQPTFAGGGQAVLKAVAGLGVDVSGCVLADGSGMSDGSKLTPAALAGTLAVASSESGGDLRALLRGLPVAGLSGSLTDRFGASSGAENGVGAVRAKTGSLTGVSALAGQVTTADGRLVSFAVIADAVPATEPARAALDRVSAGVTSCGCR